MEKDLLIQREINIYIQRMWLPSLPQSTPFCRRHRGRTTLFRNKSEENRCQLNSELLSFPKDARHEPMFTLRYSPCDSKTYTFLKNSQSSHAHRFVAHLVAPFTPPALRTECGRYIYNLHVGLEYLLSWHIFRLEIKILISHLKTDTMNDCSNKSEMMSKYRPVSTHRTRPPRKMLSRARHAKRREKMLKTKK